MYGLLFKLTHIQPGFHRSHVMENILYIDAQIYTSMSHAAFDCVSTINDVCVYLINHLFVCVWAFTQANSYSTGFSLVARHGKYPIHWCSDLHIDVARSIWLRIYYQWRVCILNQSALRVAEQRKRRWVFAWKYRPTDHVSPTTNVVERANSQAKLIITDRRSRL